MEIGTTEKLWSGKITDLLRESGPLLSTEMLNCAERFRQLAKKKGYLEPAFHIMDEDDSNDRNKPNGTKKMIWLSWPEAKVGLYISSDANINIIDADPFQSKEFSYLELEKAESYLANIFDRQR